MNYKRILMLYIEHVGYVEGSTFINYHIDGLTEEEMEELRRLDKLLSNNTVEEIADEL